MIPLSMPSLSNTFSISKRSHSSNLACSFSNRALASNKALFKNSALWPTLSKACVILWVFSNTSNARAILSFNFSLLESNFFCSKRRSYSSSFKSSFSNFIFSKFNRSSKSFWKRFLSSNNRLSFSSFSKWMNFSSSAPKRGLNAWFLFWI